MIASSSRPPGTPHRIVSPPPVNPGDKVAVLSPSWPAPAYFPAIHDQALTRIVEALGLEPVEYPTTRRAATPAERAADINAAFADPSIRAIVATVGGDDQITVLRHLDAALPTRDPKPFFGYSDNTNLLNWLWYHGLEAVHGGSTQVHLGPGPQPHDIHLRSLRAGLFGGDVPLAAPAQSCDVGITWADPAALTEPAPMLPTSNWVWAGPATSVTERTWGGNLEILQWTLAANQWMHPVEAYAGSVLLLETSEERPSPTEVYRMMRNLGERGILGAVAALLWARPPAGDHDVRPSAEQAAALRTANREAVLRAMSEYAGDVPVVLDVDFGHTIPQWVLPYGGEITVDGARGEITAHFRR